MNYIIDVSRPVREVGTSMLLGNCMWRSNISRQREPIEAIEDTDQIEEISSLLRDTTGFFTIITETKDGIAIATDVVSSIPVFYTTTDGVCYISDSHPPIIDQVDTVSLDQASVAEYRASTYVTGHHTLLDSVYQTEGGSVAEISGEEIEHRRYLDARFDGKKSRTYDEFLEILETVFSRFIGYADGQPIWIALSGGYDSRLVALALKLVGYGNIHAYSYGLEENVDSNTSRNIAEDLDIEWHFVEYTHEKWKDWYRSSERKQLDESLWINTTLPLADWPAVHELRQTGTMPSNAIVTTGQTGDVLSGSHIPTNLLDEPYVSEADFQDLILQKHYHRNDISESQQELIRDRISAVAQFMGGSGTEAISYADKWNIFERQTKHITPTIQTFEQCGVDWWLPLFDAAYLDFWAETTLEQRVGQRAYKDWVDRLYQDVTGSAPPERAKRTSSSAGHYLSKLKKVVKQSPVGPYLRQTYKKNIRSTRSSYDGMNADPRGTLTVMDYDRFDELHNGDIGLASYRARELLGNVKLQDDEWEPPIETVID